MNTGNDVMLFCDTYGAKAFLHEGKATITTLYAVGDMIIVKIKGKDVKKIPLVIWVEVSKNDEAVPIVRTFFGVTEGEVWLTEKMKEGGIENSDRGAANN